ncbi:MAG: beta-galactosidase [Muribaculaceae bacterium]|nr:beta-galactosidase [Muribaculaceae bacterium]
MIKPIKLLIALMLMSGFEVSAYKPAEGYMMTTWGENIDPENVLPEYPRPIMERPEWQNLNGLWDYAIVDKNVTTPAEYQGEILVPFCAESSLSGVAKEIGGDKAIWYKRTFAVPKSWQGRDVMLNFGAVDWQADVWVNGTKVGSHTGGYTPFGFNITHSLKSKGDNELVVRVWDPTDQGYQPRGKQVTNPTGIWYTPVTGIWQTVWLEPVNNTHVSGLKILPDIDRNTLTVNVQAAGADKGYLAEVSVKDNGRVIASGKALAGEPIVIDMPADVKLWSPDSPYLYDLEVSLKDHGKTLDKVDSYAAMRKFSIKKDDNGVVRIQLNNQDLFNYGLLDQGWWPDGLYTAPSYEAMIYDVDKAADWGYNMLRKHIKIEPATWYTYCDRKGIIVWQDMPSGDKDPEWQNRNYFDGEEFQRSPESEANYRKEWKEIIDALYNYPCIAVWTPFNEAFGQFKTPEIVNWTKAYDPSRLVNPASGGNYYHCGDMIDAHTYPSPPLIHLYDSKRANVIGEYGGIGMVVDGHVWTPDRNWGYVQYKSPAEVTDAYIGYAERLDKLAGYWYVGAVYTQLTDVENEVNGLMTYDRKVVKIDEPRIREINRRVISNHSK